MKNKMKKISTLIALSLTFAGANALAQSNTPKQNQQELVERVNFSREQLKAVMDQILNQNPKDILHADYLKKTTPFIAAVEERMNAFDQYLQNTLLAGLQEDINYYNSVFLDKDSSKEQIEQTLPGLYQRIQMKIEKLKPGYAQQIQGLYDIFGNFPAAITPTAGNGFSKFITLNNRGIRYQNKDALDDSTNVFQNYVLPMIAQDCTSFTCITFTASDYGNLLKGISERIDADFVVTLADKKTFVIPAVKRNVQEAIRLIKTNVYPNWVLALPVNSK